jgi:hypothetical protein
MHFVFRTFVFRLKLCGSVWHMWSSDTNGKILASFKIGNMLMVPVHLEVCNLFRSHLSLAQQLNTSFLRFLDRTQWHAAIGSTPLDVGSTLRRDLYLDNTQHSQQTDIHVSGWVRTRNPSRRAVTDRRLRPFGQWDRLFRLHHHYIFANPHVMCAQVYVMVICLSDCHASFMEHGYEMLQLTSGCRKPAVWPTRAFSTGRTDVCRKRDVLRVVSEKRFSCFCNTLQGICLIKYAASHLELSCSILILCFHAWMGKGSEIHGFCTFRCKVTDHRQAHKVSLSCVRHHGATLLMFQIASEFEKVVVKIPKP